MTEQYRGAPMGKPDTLTPGASQAQKFSLSWVRLNSGGYDSAGTYWGIGLPLWSYCSADGKIDGHLRAADRDQAKARLREQFPAIRFYR